jgi:hypothetical protein
MKRSFALATAIALLLSLGIAGTIRTPASPTLTEPVASTCAIPPGTLAITLCGTPFVDRTGATVVLPGATTEGTRYECAPSGSGTFDDPAASGTNYSAKISAMQTRALNVVRVNLNEECLRQRR